MDSRKHGWPVISNMTGNTVLMAENRQLKVELASVKNELMQSTWEKDEARQLYSRCKLQCIELADEVRRLNDILFNVQSLNASTSMERVVSHGTIQGMASTNTEQQRRSKQSPSVGGGSLWKHLKRNDIIGSGDSAHTNPDVKNSGGRAQSYSISSQEREVSQGISVAKNTESNLEEAEISLLKDEEEWYLQQSSDIEMDFDGENDWIYETLDDMAPAEQLIEEDSKRKVFAQQTPLEWDGAWVENAALSSLDQTLHNPLKLSVANALAVPSSGKSFECYICKKTFTRKYSLSCHFRSHTGKGLFYCSYQSCGKSFTTQNHLTPHTRIHMGERPFECEFPGCKSRFAQNNDLTRHRQLHTGEKPYVCKWTGCAARFRRNYRLTAHISTEHQGTGAK